MKNKYYVIWFTGLSGSGKTTIAKELSKYVDCFHLDGDILRSGLCSDLTYTLDDRMENHRRAAEVAKLLSNNQHVLATFISPTEEIRDMIKDIIGDKLIMVYVKTSLEECERRDVKGLYKKARDGKIPMFTGIDSPYDVPIDEDITIDTEQLTVEQCAARILLLTNDQWQ